MRTLTAIEKTPAYGLAEASRYLRLPRAKARRWATALCTARDREIFPLSFANLLELYVLKAMRLTHTVPMQRIRRAVVHLRERYTSPFPLLQADFLTDGLDVLIREDESIINLSRYGQHTIQEVVGLYMKRIEIDQNMAKLYPFITADRADEPRSVLISPGIAFGRPVISGTGISTEVIAGRFYARESLTSLAEEYMLDPVQLEEAIRWEMTGADAA